MADSKKRQNAAKPLCKYGIDCYQKNPEHHRKYRHPSPKPKKGTLTVKQSDPSKRSPKRKVAEDDAGKPSVTNLAVPSEDDAPKTSPRKRQACGQRPPSPIDVAENIKEKFLVEMPSDFYDLWEFCNSVCPEDPSETFSDLQLHLVGPYDILAKKISNKDISGDNILCHYRYYYDPPEFQTVITRDGDDWFHIGYFRDDPSEMPFGLAANSAALGPKFKLVGDNIFAAVNSELTAALKKTKKGLKEKFSVIQEDLQKFAKKKNYSLELETLKTKARNKKVVAKTFHGFGIVVPYDKSREFGYRPLPETNARLKTILTKIVDCQTEEARLNNRTPLDDILTSVQFANDECDYGMGLELGIDLFCFGDRYFHSDILMILPLAYDLLGRSEFGKVVHAHLSRRRKGDKVSIKNESESD